MKLNIMAFSMARGSLSLIAISLFITSAVIHAADFDSSLSNYSRQFAMGVGVNANYVFTAGNNYPPIADDVSFWCITP